MKTAQENKEKEGRQVFAEFQELYCQLSALQRVQFSLYIKWIVLQRYWGKWIWNWLIFQWQMDEKIKKQFPRRAETRPSASTAPAANDGDMTTRFYGPHV